MKRFLAALTVALVSSTAIAQVQTQTPSVPAMMETISVTGTGRSTVTAVLVTEGERRVSPEPPDCHGNRNFP